MISVIVVPQDQLHAVYQEELDPQDLGAYRAIVGGDLEAVSLSQPGCLAYVNEDGKCLGAPINSQASVLAWVHNSKLRRLRDPICGPMLIVGPPNRQGVSTSVPDELIELLFKAEQYAVEIRVGNKWTAHGERVIAPHWMLAYTRALSIAGDVPGAQEFRVVPATN